jgi:hypothetical protein
MRQLVTGIDGSGQSCVLRETVVQPTSPEPFYETAVDPPPQRPPGRGDFVDLGVPVGKARWLVVQLAPGFHYGMHNTDTIDCDTVLDGNIDLILDDGRHSLTVGDCVVVTGVDHAWEAGPDGCTMAFLFLGTPPPA